MLARKNIPIVFTTPGALMVKALAARARAGKPLDAEDEAMGQGMVWVKIKDLY
jgi:hypothetical protein